MTVLVVAKIENNHIESSTLNAVTAGKKLGNITILLAGPNLTDAIEEAKKIDGIKKILVVDNESFEYRLAENFAKLIQSIAEPFDYIIGASNTFFKNILPRAAALLDKTQVSDVIDIIDEKTFIHPIYAGNALETVKVNDEKIILTIRTTAFDEAERNNQGDVEVESIQFDYENTKSKFLSIEIIKSDRPELTQAKVIVSGGRGLGSKEKFDELLNPLAEKLNAAIGASRAAVDSGYADNSLQVGQTGKIVAPELYIAIGISGAIQHLAGMQDSKTIVAINKDPEAPIFKVATLGLVGDLFTIVPEIISKLQ